MRIEQFEDKGLAHYSYALLSENTGEIVLVDPARNPKPYFEYAEANKAKIVGVIETHPHADFVSSHLEIHARTGATIYVSKLVQADYPHEAFDEGAAITLGDTRLKALNTPGHSPDSISIVVEKDGKDYAVFTGDTLFIGDVGRPDLRESAGNNTAKREELAKQMYHSTREKLMKLDDEVVVYPAHGAGTLCGKALSEANSSTIGVEKRSNYALRDMTEEEFVQLLVEDQPFTPKYFGYNVALNKKGAPAYDESLKEIKWFDADFRPGAQEMVVDARDQKTFKKGHFSNALNIQNGNKFETWLGSIIGPDETFYLTAASKDTLNELISKAAKIGYERNIKGVFVIEGDAPVFSPEIDLEDFRKHQENYTILDIRNTSEVKSGSIFEKAIHIPLHALRERAQEVPSGKTVVVHCAGGYRSAAGSSILESALPGTQVLDLSEAISQFK